MEFYGNYQVYSESGVDLTLLGENLRRSVEERLDKNARSLPFLEALRGSNKNQRKVLDAPAFALLCRLANHKVDFVVIGGLAMIAHGCSNTRQDMDICYSRYSKNLQALVSSLDQIRPRLRGAPEGLSISWNVPTIQAGMNFTLTTDLGDID